MGLSVKIQFDIKITDNNKNKVTHSNNNKFCHFHFYDTLVF